LLVYFLLRFQITSHIREAGKKGQEYYISSKRIQLPVRELIMVFIKHPLAVVISVSPLLPGDAADEKIVSISGSSDTLVALSAKGEIFIWGQCEYGQAGIGNDTIQVRCPACVNKW
ncbi:hypothetical protein ANCCEY_03750, partial [Ancylostoma ceylanicum]